MASANSWDASGYRTLWTSIALPVRVGRGDVPVRQRDLPVARSELGAKRSAAAAPCWRSQGHTLITAQAPRRNPGTASLG
ncbi:unnamed protein product [Lota lota]